MILVICLLISPTILIHLDQGLKSDQPSDRQTSTKKTKFITDDFNVDSYISVKNKDEWYNYLAEYTKAYQEENSSVWKTENPIICYLAVRVFPLEYVDEVQKVFGRIRFSTNCGIRRDVVFMSPILEDSPYNKKTHPRTILVSTHINSFFEYLSHIL